MKYNNQRIETANAIKYIIHKNLWTETYKNRHFKTKVVRVNPLKADQEYWIESKRLNDKSYEFANNFDESIGLYIFDGRGKKRLELTEEEGLILQLILNQIYNDIAKINFLQEHAEMTNSDIKTIEMDEEHFEQLALDFEKHIGG